MNDFLHEEIAAALGWTLSDVRSFSLSTLRDVLHQTHPRLALKIDGAIRTGRHVHAHRRQRNTR